MTHANATLDVRLEMLVSAAALLSKDAPSALGLHPNAEALLDLMRRPQRSPRDILWSELESRERRLSVSGGRRPEDDPVVAGAAAFVRTRALDRSAGLRFAVERLGDPWSRLIGLPAAKLRPLLNRVGVRLAAAALGRREGEDAADFLGVFTPASIGHILAERLAVRDKRALQLREASAAWIQAEAGPGSTEPWRLGLALTAGAVGELSPDCAADIKRIQRANLLELMMRTRPLELDQDLRKAGARLVNRLLKERE